MGEYPLKNKKVLVTGAGGSIGSQIAKELLREEGIRKLYLLDMSELALYNVKKELEPYCRATEIIPVLLDLKDLELLELFMRDAGIEVVIHAAAYKHIDIAEENPFSVLYNNVVGTDNLLAICSHYDVERFILLSTDKAVEPDSVYGISKLLSEIITLYGPSGGGMCGIVVRLANVEGASGSVIPLFKKQIEQGVVVTVTHKDMKRFFMSMEEAVDLVLNVAKKGEWGIYVPDIVEPKRIMDIALGLIGEEHIPIEFTGLRKGERMEEKLIRDDEEVASTSMKGVVKVTPSPDYSSNYMAKNHAVFLIEALCGRHPGSMSVGDKKELKKYIIKPLSGITIDWEGVYGR